MDRKELKKMDNDEYKNVNNETGFDAPEANKNMYALGANEGTNDNVMDDDRLTQKDENNNDSVLDDNELTTEGADPLSNVKSDLSGDIDDDDDELDDDLDLEDEGDNDDLLEDADDEDDLNMRNNKDDGFELKNFDDYQYILFPKDILLEPTTDETKESYFDDDIDYYA